MQQRATQSRILRRPFSIHWHPSSDWVAHFPRRVVVRRPVSSSEVKNELKWGQTSQAAKRTWACLDSVSLSVTVLAAAPFFGGIARKRADNERRNWRRKEFSHLLDVLMDRFEFEAEKENDRRTKNRECLDFKRTKTLATLVYSRSVGRRFT